MLKEKDRKYYTADFETLVLTPEQIKKGARTYVWAWALCDIDNVDDVVYGTDIQSFLKALGKLSSGSTVYFHNLKYDGQFLLSYLIEKGYKEAISNKKMPENSYTSLVSEIGTWYGLNIRTNKKTIRIYDSYKKLPFTVAKLAKDLGYEEQKGEIDYKEYRAEGGILSDEDKDYIRRDVQIVAKALKSVCFDKDMYGMTIGSDCMKYYKAMTPKFDKWFPVLEENIDKFCRKAYKGGYCYVNPKYQEKYLEISGSTFDANSLYPSVQHSKLGYKYPYGQPVYYKGNYIKDSYYPLFIQHFYAAFELKEGYVPTVQVKTSKFYKENEYLIEVKEPIDLYMTNIDLGILFEHYDVTFYEPIDGYKFHGIIGAFDKYIDYWYNYKEKATKTGDKVGRLVSKLMLNNLGGRFAVSPKANTLSFYLDENNIMRHHLVEDVKDSVYLPVAAFMTAYGRKELFSAISKVGLDKYCYSDTDSLHVLADEVKGLNVDDSALGAWKKESTWTAAKFLRQKTYAEYINNEWEYKGCGMNEEVKANIGSIDNFEINGVYEGKKVVKHVPGGVVICDTTFKLSKI